MCRKEKQREADQDSVSQSLCVGHGDVNKSHSYLSYQLAPAVHAQVEVGFFAPDSHLATKGVCLHYELGL